MAHFQSPTSGADSSAFDANDTVNGGDDNDALSGNDDDDTVNVDDGDTDDTANGNDGTDTWIVDADPAEVGVGCNTVTVNP